MIGVWKVVQGALYYAIAYHIELLACVPPLLLLSNLRPHDFFVTGTHKAYLYGCNTTLGRFTFCDLQTTISVACDNPVISGKATYADSQFTLDGSYYNTQVHFSVGRTQNQCLVHAQFASTAASKQFHGTASLAGNDVALRLDCKCIDPGIRDFAFVVRGTLPGPLDGKFAGTFYTNKFSGVMRGYPHFGAGTLQCDLLPPTKLAWRNTTLYLNSALGRGSVDLITRDGMLYFYNHTADINHDQVHITGPDVCISMYNRTLDTKIAGPSMIYAGDLIRAIVWMESFKECGSTKVYRVICDNFQTRGMRAQVYGNPGRVHATFSNQRSTLRVHRLHNNLSVRCSDIQAFERLVGKFAVTSGQVSIHATKRTKVWTGQFKIKNARILPEYQSKLRGIGDQWNVCGRWSFNGRKLKIYDIDAHNNDAVVRLRIQIDRFHQRKRIVLRGSIYKRNKIINLLTPLTSRKNIHAIFGSGFYATGPADSPTFETSKANVVLGWVSFLPV